MPEFAFDDATSFESHKGTEPEPKRRGGRTTKAGGNPKAAPEPAPDSAPEPKPPARKNGLPRNGRWPMRDRKSTGKQRPHGWALSGQWRPIYVRALAQYGLHTHAADKAEVHPTTVLRARKADPEFEAQCEEAMERFRDGLREEVLRRAIVGREQKVFDKRTGEVVSLGNVPDNLLLMFVMKRFDPSFRDNYHAEDQSGAQAVTQVVVNFLKQFDARSDDQADMPTFEAFMKEQGPAALPAPPETKEERRARLMAELAALDAEPAEATTPHADA